MTNASLASQLAVYLKTSDLTSKLANYVTTDSLNSAITAALSNVTILTTLSEQIFPNLKNSQTFICNQADQYLHIKVHCWVFCYFYNGTNRGNEQELYIGSRHIGRIVSNDTNKESTLVLCKPGDTLTVSYGPGFEGRVCPCTFETSTPLFEINNKM